MSGHVSAGFQNFLRGIFSGRGDRGDAEPAASCAPRRPRFGHCYALYCSDSIHTPLPAAPDGIRSALLRWSEASPRYSSTRPGAFLIARRAMCLCPYPRRKTPRPPRSRSPVCRAILSACHRRGAPHCQLITVNAAILERHIALLGIDTPMMRPA